MVEPPSAVLSFRRSISNLYVLLDDEKLAGATALNEALAPYWPVLWRVAARGHYFARREPVRETGRREPMYQPAIPSLRESGYTLSFARGEGREFSVLLSFPGARGPMYPLGTYPMIAEFRAMLAAIPPKAKSPLHWDGQQFYGYVSEREKEAESGFAPTRTGSRSVFPARSGRRCGSCSAGRGMFRRSGSRGMP
jgi:hypothetical protein